MRTGLGAFNTMLNDDRIFAEQLDNILKLLKHPSQEVVDEAGNTAWWMIISGYDLNEEFIKNLKDEFKKSDNQMFKSFLELMGDYLDAKKE